MRVEVPYGSGHLSIEIDERSFGGTVLPNEPEVGDEGQTLSDALSHPTGPKTFREFLSDARELVVLVNDRTRSTPTARMLEHIYPDIRNIETTFIVATGSHRPPTADECREIFGGLYDVCSRTVVVHDARKKEDMVHIGRTEYGTDVELNRRVAGAGKILVIGSVKPHYFAGYTGGRKSFIPGVASYETIEQNHSHALSPNARALRLEGNPVHEDMESALRLLDERDIFSIQAVLDRRHRIYAAAAGDIHESFHAAVRPSSDLASVPVERKAQVVVAVAPYPPVDNLYQTQHSLDNAALALEDGGIVILVSQCSGGTGNGAFIELASSVSTPEEALEKIAEGYRLGYHKIARMAELSRWAEMWAVSDLDPEILRSVFMRPFDSLQQAIDQALAVKGSAKVLFLMAASLTVPRVD
jgi:nickel-dependent lactate racemase